MKKVSILIGIVIFISCKKEVKIENLASNKSNDTVIVSKKHKPNKIICDLDGDKRNDIIEIMYSTLHKKSGLRIVFGSGKQIDYFGFGNEVLKQGFNNFDWVGIFEKAPKGNIYFNNIDEKTGDILTELEVNESDKIKLVNDGIFIHANESCGGGVIYWDNGAFRWIQQE